MFSKLLLEMHDKLTSQQFQEAISCFTVEKQNFRKLFTDVRYATEDTYPLFIQVATKASENILHYFLGCK